MTYKRINANNDDIDVEEGARIRGVLLTAGSNAATLTLFRGATQVAGEEMLVIGAPAAKTSFFMPIAEPGLFVQGKMSVTITGTSADAYLYYE